MLNRWRTSCAGAVVALGCMLAPMASSSGQAAPTKPTADTIKKTPARGEAHRGAQGHDHEDTDRAGRCLSSTALRHRRRLGGAGRRGRSRADGRA